MTRDVDVLGRLASHGAVSVNLSITTLDPALHRVMEPRAAHPAQRLHAIETLARAGIPVGVMIGPVIPGLTDHEIPRILEAAGRAGASFAGHILLRLPHAVAELFEVWLEQHFPDRKDKVLGRVRSVRGGRINDPRFGSRMRGEGVFAEQIHQLFDVARRRARIGDERPELDASHFRPPRAPQLDLFGD